MTFGQDLRTIYEDTQTIAIIGASPDPSKPSHTRPRYLQTQGYRIIPVTPRGGEVLGEPAHASLSDVDVPIDVVNVFRPPEEVPDIARQAAAVGAKVLWTQTGIELEDRRGDCARRRLNGGHGHAHVADARRSGSGARTGLATRAPT